MMSKNHKLVLPEIIHKALKIWERADQNDSPFTHLQLHKQARRNGSVSAHQATDCILSNGLDELEAIDKDSAELLYKRFRDKILVHTIAYRDSVGQSTIYRRQNAAIKQLTSIIESREVQAQEKYQFDLEQRLQLPTQTTLSGVQTHLDHLLDQLIAPEPPWIVSIEGLGGIGKTALANVILRRPELSGLFEETAWVSAKQREYIPGIGLATEEIPALTIDTLVDIVLEQCTDDVPLQQTLPEKRMALKQLLKNAPYLIVIDNLETVTDYQSLLPILQEITNPSKVLLTSRHSLHGYPGVFCLTLDALNREATFDLIREEAKSPQLSALANADEMAWQRIYDTVGGNPLALKMVIGQTAFLSLSYVLDSLIGAEDKEYADLYTHIYWQAWQMMDDVSRQALLVMPLNHNGTFEQIQFNSQLEPAELRQALKQLTTLSLIQISGGLDKRRYAIHRLTESFLLNEATRWPSSN